MDNKYDDNNTLNSITNDSIANMLADTMHHDTNFENVTQYSALSEQELSSIVNVTREYPFDYATIVFGYIMPFVLVLTLITNTLVVMVLAQPHMRTPTNIVLFTMAIVDLMTLLSPSPWYFYIYTLGYHDKFLHPPIACYAHHLMTDVIPVFFHTSSIWLALLLASQRYIYVCHPTLARTWCTVPRVKKAIMIILTVAFSHQITRFFDNTFESVTIQLDHVNHLACKNDISWWVHRIDPAVYYSAYFIFRILFVLTTPCVALITLNCLLFRALRRAENKRTELLRTKFKLIGSNHCSVGGLYDKRSSFMNKRNNSSNNAQGATGATREPSTSGVGGGVGRESKLIGKNGGIDKRRKFCIPSFPMIRRQRNSNARNINNSPSNLITINQTSDTKLSGSMFEDQLGSISNNEGCDRREKIDNRSNKKEDESGGEHLNDSCSVTTTHSKDNAQGEQSKSKLIRGKQFESTGRAASLDEDIQSGKDEDFICAECAACERKEELECQRCSAAANDGAIGDRNGDLHQAISQCSSLMGGATNTTTNEDASSCVVTQNASSSMYVVHDGTLDPIEASSMRGDDVEDIDIEEETAQSPVHRVCTDEAKLVKSGSVDSRLICGCLSSANRMKQKQNCRECCLSHDNRRSPRRFTSSSLSGKVGKDNRAKCLASCSNSDPCMNCDNRKRLNKKRCGSDAHDGQTNHTLPTSQSDYGNQACEDNKRSNVDIFTSGKTIATNTTTTTTNTTNLHSTNTNSIGSLVQVAQHPNITKMQGSQIGNLQGDLKYSSGRVSSRGASMRGSHPAPLMVPSNLTATSQVSMRTMDSNRTTLMLIVVVTVFLMVEVPVAIVTIVHVILNSFDVFEDIESLNYIKLFTNFSIMISYSVNFTIYCSMSKKFRDTFRDLFLCRNRAKRKRVQRLLYHQHNQQLQQTSHYNPHQFNNQDNSNQVMPSSNVNSGCANLQDDYATHAASVLNNNTDAMRYSPYGKIISQQQECEV